MAPAGACSAAIRRSVLAMAAGTLNSGEYHPQAKGVSSHAPPPSAPTRCPTPNRSTISGDTAIGWQHVRLRLLSGQLRRLAVGRRVGLLALATTLLVLGASTGPASSVSTAARNPQPVRARVLVEGSPGKEPALGTVQSGTRITAPAQTIKAGLSDPGQDWPTYRHDVARSGASTESILNVGNAPDLRQAWSHATRGPVASSPAVVGGTVYVGSWDGYEYALNGTNGKLLWRTYLGIDNDPACYPKVLGITSSATVSNGVVYVGGGNADWYALSAATGRVLWDVPTGRSGLTGAHYNWSSPLIYGNDAYIGIASTCDKPQVQGQLLKVDLTTHQIVAEEQFVPQGEGGGGVWTSPTLDIATNTIFVATANLTVYTQDLAQSVLALNASTLAVESSWQLPFVAAVEDSDWGTSPVLTVDSQGRQLVSVANKNGVLYTFLRNDLAAGPIWQHAISFGGDCPYCGDGTVASGIYANGTLYYAGGNIEVDDVGHQGSISAFNPGTGQVLWTHYLSGVPVGSPSYENGVIYVPAGEYLLALNAANGAALWTYDLEAGTYGAPAISDGTVYLGTLDDAVHAFALPARLPTPPSRDPRCPSGFTCQDVGHPAASGGERVRSNGSISLAGPGVGMRGAEDQMRMVTEPISGNAHVSAQILALATNQSNSAPQVGIVMRASDAPGSPAYQVVMTRNGTEAPHLSISVRRAWDSRPIVIEQLGGLALPRWVMVERVGDTFQALSSRDGQHWRLISGSVYAATLPTTVLAGIAAAGGGARSVGQVSYGSLRVVSSTVAYTLPRSAHPCPSHWSCADVGAAAPIGDQTLRAGAWKIYGTGVGIGAFSDQLHFIYQRLDGDGTITGGLMSRAASPAGSQSAILMRSSDSAASPYYGVVVEANGTASLRWRVYDGIQNKLQIPVPKVSRPTWFEIDRYTDTNYGPATTYYSLLTSADGVNWTEIQGSTMGLNLGDTLLAGVGGAAGKPGSKTTSVWTKLSVQKRELPTVGICPQSFACADVGVGFRPGGQEYSKGTWRIYAGGGDISSIFDQFQFVYQSLPADGTLSAEVDSVGRHPGFGNGGAKTGLMLRASVDPQAPYYAVFQTPAHGISVQWRTAEGGPTELDLVPGTAPAYPVFLMIGRWTSGGVTDYTAYTSSEGQHFTPVPGSTLALDLPGTLLAGMAADSYTPIFDLPVTFSKFNLSAGRELAAP